MTDLSPAPTVVRRALPTDRRGMAEVHVASWKSTYRGIVPDGALDRMSVETDLARGFGKWLESPRPGWEAFVATRSDGGIVGFAISERANDPHPPEFTGELGALYILQEFQRRGLGRRLFAEAVRHLDFHGHRSMMLWVLERNPACGFYEAMGGKVVARRMRPTAGTSLAAVAYGWTDLPALRATLRAADPPPTPPPGPGPSTPRSS